MDRAPARPARAGPLVALSYLAVLTHPALDWLNTYGIRLLMPFDSRWFYGDALFIIDPWLWLVAGTAVVLAYTRSVLGITAWFVVGLALTALLSGFAVVPPASRLVWVVGVGPAAPPAPHRSRVSCMCRRLHLGHGRRVTRRRTSGNRLAG